MTGANTVPIGRNTTIRVTSLRRGVANYRSDKPIDRLCFRTNHDVHNYQSDGKERVMDETKVQIGEDVLLDIGVHSDWYISSIGYDYDCGSVNVSLRRKADRNKEWWLADTPQTDAYDYKGHGKWERSE